jgi:tetratricopeptide (TPR) repeat protein
LVIEDESDDIAKFYSNDYRGRVQNQEVDVEPQPLYVLTFSVKPSDVIQRKDYAAFVDKLNAAKIFNRELFISARESPVSETEIKNFDAENGRLVKQIGRGRASTLQLFALAMIASAKRDYQSAVSSLNQAIQVDSDFEAALFLRTVVRSRQLETQSSESQIKSQSAKGQTQLQTDVAKINYGPLIADLSHAILIDSKCPYLYYDRACLYSKTKQTYEAVADYSKAIDLLPDLAEAYYNRGLLYVGVGEYEKGFTDLSKAGELGLYAAYSLMKQFRKVQSSQKK